MTTFHELLGTDDSCSIAEIKKKYRQLSVRLHPDKGGSQALMQMLNMAYQQVIKGCGNKLCSDIIFKQEDKNSQNFKNKIIELVKEKEKLQALLEQHKQNVEHAFSAGEKSTQQTLILLQVTNNQLNKQLVLLRRQIEEDGNNNSLSKKANKKYRFIIMFIILSIIITVAGGVWYYQTQHQQRQSFVSTSVPITTQVKNVIATQPTTVEYVDTMNNADKIMIMNTTGLWQQRYYEGTRQPYIAVRSINGSYIVKDCQGTFSYYSNRLHNTTHISANLIFSANDRYFSVYRIPYGNGSSNQQWLESKSLSINSNIFSNKGYKSSALALAAVCSNTVPF